MEDVELKQNFDEIRGAIHSVVNSMDTLARITAENFTAVEKRFDGLEEKLVGKIEGVQRSVDGAYERHTALETRVTKLETVQQ